MEFQTDRNQWNYQEKTKRTRRRFRSVPFKRSIYFPTEIYDHFGIVESILGSRSRSYNLWWPTTVTAKPKTSRQKQKHHGKTKNLTAKIKYLTAKTKYLTAKPKTSRQNQILHSKNKIALVLPWVFALAVRYLAFAVEYLVLP